MIALLLALACAASEPHADAPQPPPEASATPEAPPEPARNSLELNAGAGAGAGLFLVAPYAGPGLGGGLSYERRIGESGLFGAVLKLDLGFESASPVADYGALLRLGRLWVSTERLELGSELHAGVGSVALIPLPLLGLGHHLTLIPLAGRWAEWKLGVELSTDLLLILPGAAGDVWTSVALKLGWFRLGLRGSAGAGGFFPLEGGVSATARLYTGAVF